MTAPAGQWGGGQAPAARWAANGGARRAGRQLEFIWACDMFLKDLAPGAVPSRLPRRVTGRRAAPRPAGQRQGPGQAPAPAPGQAPGQAAGPGEPPRPAPPSLPPGRRRRPAATGTEPGGLGRPRDPRGSAAAGCEGSSPGGEVWGGLGFGGVLAAGLPGGVGAQMAALGGCRGLWGRARGWGKHSGAPCCPLGQPGDGASGARQLPCCARVSPGCGAQPSPARLSRPVPGAPGCAGRAAPLAPAARDRAIFLIPSRG